MYVIKVRFHDDLNSEEVNERAKQYYQREKSVYQLSELMMRDCGSQGTSGHKSRHSENERHKQYSHYSNTQV